MLLFYPLIALAVVILAIIFTETERWGWATITFIGSVTALHFVGGVNVLAFLQVHLVEVGLYSLLYLAAGVVWSFVKWFSFLHRSRDDLRERREKFKDSYEKHIKSSQYAPQSRKIAVPGRLDLPGEEEKEPIKIPTFEDYLRDYGSSSLKRPTAADNKGRIIGWMAFWPFSFVGTFLNDPVRRLFNALFRHFKMLYQKMVDHVFRNDPDLV